MYNQTQQIIEYWDRLGDDPRNGPGSEANCDPGTSGQQTPLVHVVRTLAAEDSDVDILAGNMAEDDTGDDDLLAVLAEPSKRMVIN